MLLKSKKIYLDVSFYQLFFMNYDRVQVLFTIRQTSAFLEQNCKLQLARKALLKSHVRTANFSNLVE